MTSISRSEELHQLCSIPLAAVKAVAAAVAANAAAVV